MKIKQKLWAMFKIWLAIYPSITLLYYLLGNKLAALSLPIKTLALTGVLVPWMIFAALPAVELLLAKLKPTNTKP